MSELLSPQVRTYIYGICLAVVPILIGFGVITQEQAPLIIALIGSLLGLGTAVAHRPTKPADE